MSISLSQIEKESNFFLDLNNDLDRITKLLNLNQDVKKLLYYIDADALSKDDVTISLLGLTINKVPLVPLASRTGIDASYIYTTLLMSDVDLLNGVAMTNVAIDILTPTDQWIVNEGIRPLLLSYYINKIMENQFVQTGGIKYRLTQIINIKMSDNLLGYRLIYATGLDD